MIPQLAMLLHVPRFPHDPTMNHLAHLVLAGSDEGLRLGAFLGDHVKGKMALEKLPFDWVRGIYLHRHIDSISDSRPEIRRFIADLKAPWRRYGGIFLDVLFDHMLARHWSEFGPCALDEYSAQIDDMLERHDASLPPRLQRFRRWARERGLWSNYGDRATIEAIFQGLSWRHGRPSPLARGLEVLDAHEADIERLFLKIFPEIRAQTARWRSYSSISRM